MVGAGKLPHRRRSTRRKEGARMAGPRYTLTEKYQREVCSSVRDGGSPGPASEAAGIPRLVMQRWLRAGRSPRAQPRYKDFADALMTARARARAEHQARTYREHPRERGTDERDRRR